MVFDQVLVDADGIAAEPHLGLDPGAVRRAGRRRGGGACRDGAPGTSAEAGGRGGGVCSPLRAEPVATAEEFASR